MGSYRCAICERAVSYTGPLPPTYPFCSERCRMVDLGKWLREQYTIDRDLSPEELPQPTANQPDDSSSNGSANADR